MDASATDAGVGGREGGIETQLECITLPVPRTLSSCFGLERSQTEQQRAAAGATARAEGGMEEAASYTLELETLEGVDASLELVLERDRCEARGDVRSCLLLLSPLLGWAEDATATAAPAGDKEVEANAGELLE
jgi:hypothetical protein